jgi:hypothetical protein
MVAVLKWARAVYGELRRFFLLFRCGRACHMGPPQCPGRVAVFYCTCAVPGMHASAPLPAFHGPPPARRGQQAGERRTGLARACAAAWPCQA